MFLALTAYQILSNYSSDFKVRVKYCKTSWNTLLRLVNSEDRGIRILRNVGNYLLVDTPRKIWVFTDTRLCDAELYWLRIMISRNDRCWREEILAKVGRVQLKPDGTRWRTGGEVKGKLTNGVGSQYSQATSEHGVSSITTADVHASAAGSRPNWRPRRFK